MYNFVLVFNLLVCFHFHLDSIQSSGSESGTQTQKSLKSRGSDKSGNSASDDGENEASNGLNIGDGSDDGSGAQVVQFLFLICELYNFICLLTILLFLFWLK